MSDTLKQAIAVIKAGDKATGQRLLTEILKTEPRNENAWLWLSSLVESEAQRRHCLTNVLKINPNNELAQRGLASLQSPPAEVAPPPPPQDQTPPAPGTLKKLRHLAPKTETEPAPDQSDQVNEGDSGEISYFESEPFESSPEEQVPQMSVEVALQQVAAARMQGLTPNLNEINLANASLSGVDLSEASLRKVDLSQANLSQANLRYTNLFQANLRGAILTEANLSEAKLMEADLSGADLRRANLSGVHLGQTNLEGAILAGAQMSRADLSQANLSGADLTGTDLDGANLGETNLTGILHDQKTKWPAGFTPPAEGQIIFPARKDTRPTKTATPPPVQINPAVKKFLTDDQDPAVVQQVYPRVSEILTSEEAIIYIAVQNKPVVNVAPDCIVVTNRRFIIYRPKLLGGIDFTDYIWRNLYDAQLEEGMVGATIRMKTVDGHIFSIGYLPKKQARRLYAIAQEMEEHVAEQRRLRDMEEKRAAAGGVYMQRVSIPGQGQTSVPASSETSSLIGPGEAGKALPEPEPDQVIIQPPALQSSSQPSSGLKKFLNEEQDPAVVRQVYSRVSEILTREESILYIAVQNKPLVNLTPVCVILTNRRFIIYNPKLLGGANFKDHIWRELHDAHLNEGIMGATFTIKTYGNLIITVDYLPKKQARRLYALAQEMEERVAEQRRLRQMEEKRAAAGGVFVQEAMTVPPQSAPTPASVVQEDPLQKLKQLKEMLDSGLITAAEFEAKKAEILSRM